MVSKGFTRLSLLGVICMCLVPAASAEETDAGEDTAGAVFEHVSCRGSQNEIRVIVEGVKDGVGLMRADLYKNDENGFLKKAGQIKKVRFAARAPATKFCIEAPASGNYAIAVYQDENANLTFDKKAFGLPAEPYGISNNPKLRFAPPTIDQALFSVAEKDGATVVIELKN